MGEDEITELSWRWAAAFVALLAVTIAAYFLFHLERKEAEREIFAALCEVCAGVVFVGLGFRWHRAAEAKTRQKERILQALRRARTEIEHSRTLIRTHKSAKTWYEQVEALVRVRVELQSLETDMTRNSQFRDAAAALREVIGRIAALQTEYEEKHDEVACMQGRFEIDWKDKPEKKKEALPEHWKRIQKELPELATMLEDDSLLKPLNTTIGWTS